MSETYTVASGVTSTGIILNHNDRLNILDGGVANDTKVNSKGELNIYSGGVADNTLVRSDGMLQIFSDGEADNTVVNYGGRMFVSSGGTANTISAEGTVGVFEDGAVSDATVNYNARLYVLPGGTAFKATVNNQGYFCVSSGGTASDITVVSGGSLFVDTGGAVDQVNAENGAYLGIVVTPDTSAKGTSGGIAFETKDGILSGFTNSRGHIDVVSGGVGCETTVDLRGTLGVSKGGRIEDTVVNENGSLMVGSDGTAYNTTVHSGGIMKVSYDGKVTGRMTFDTGAAVSFDSRAFLDFDLTQHRLDAASLLNDLSIVTGTPIYTLTVDGNQSIGSYKLADGAAGFSGTVTVKNALGTSLGTISVDGAAVSFGIQQYTLKRNESNLYVEVTSASGTDDLFIGTVVGETKIITAGKSAIADVGRDGILLIESEGNVSNTIIRDGGLLVVSSGGKMAGITVEQGGKATVSDSVVASSVVVNGGEMLLESGASAIQGHSALDSSNLIVKNGGKLIIDGGKVAGVTVSSGHVVVADKGLFYNGTCSSANVVAQDGATVSAMTFIDGGILNAASGAVLKEITLYEGGAITGILRNASKLKLNNGTLELNIGNASPGSEFLVDAASFGAIQPTVLYSYRCTLAVGDSQAYGTYKLIEGAVGFDKSITVVNASGTMLDTLALGATTNINGVDYELNLGGDNSLTVTLSDTVLPVVSNMVADITTPTNGSVTVTADFTDNVGVIASLYKTGDGAWIDYTDAGVIVNENTTIFFKAIDAAGNESRKTSYAVTNIDKVVPTITGITPSTTEPATSVTVTAVFDDDVELSTTLYRIGDGGWFNYNLEGVTVTTNTTVYFKATDTAGNATTASYDVTNIETTTPDTTPPEKPIPDASSKEPTNGYVIVTATFSEDSVIRECSKDGVNWIEYQSSGLTFVENGKAYFRGTDSAENVSDIAVYEVTNIDKEAPTITGITPSTTAPATSVTVTAVFDDDVELSTTLYRIGDGGWFNYNLEGVTVTTNTTVYFKATDTAGNATTASYDVTNITGGGSVDLTGDLSDSYELTAGMVGSSVNILDGGNLEVFEGGFTSQTTVNSGGDLAVSEGGVADVVTVNFGGDLYVRNGGVATLVKENGGYASVNDGATATFVSNSFGGYVYNNADDWCTIHSGTTGTDLTVGNKGRIYVYSGGIASDTTVNDKGIVEGNSGGLIDGVVVNSGGSLLLYSGAKLTGQMTFASGAEVIPFVGSILDFDLTQTAPDAAALVNDLSILMGTPGYTLTVDGTQASGTYNLAGNATGFSKAISVRNTSGVDYGYLTFGGTLSTAFANFTLNLTSDDTLTVNVAAKGGSDTTPPTITITPSTTEPTTSVTVSAVFSDDVAVATKQYRVGDGDWKDYTDPVPVTENVTVGFRATDTSGNATVENYLVTNIENEPENDKLYNKKTGWADSENIATFSVNEVVAGDSMVYLDKKGSVESEDGKYFNSVGRTGTVEDTADYAKIELAYGAALKFSVDSTIGGTFYVYEATQNKKGDLVATQRQKISVKAGKISPAKLSTIYLEAGEYFVGMEAKLPAAKKNPEVSAYYNVQLTGTKYYEDADDGWNDHAYALDANGKEDKTKLNALLVSGASDFGRGATAIEPDTGKEWVGFSDATDYKMIRLENAVNLTLKFTASGKAKLAIWKVSTGKNGKITLTSKGSVTVKADKTGTIKAKFLDAGEYFVSVTSTDAKKGGDAYYSIAVDPATVFFDSADDGRNNVLYDKNAKSFYVEDVSHHFETTTIGTETHVKLDTDPVADTDWENFVGYQDAADYAKIKLTSDGKLSFHLEASGDATFTVYKKGQDKKGNDTLETIRTDKLALGKGESKTEKDIQISDLEAGEYYVSMAAKSTKANSTGSVFYNVTATLDAVVTSALEMPMAAAAYADSVQDKLFGETGNGLLA